jgi:hypothetical protein
MFVFPGPGQELVDSLGRMILQTREHVGEYAPPPVR